jgi:hypothetical protein
LDVEEKVRAKDVRGKKTVEGSSSAHVAQKNPQHSHKKEIPIRTQAKEHYTF